MREFGQPPPGAEMTGEIKPEVSLEDLKNKIEGMNLGEAFGKVGEFHQALGALNHLSSEIPDLRKYFIGKIEEAEKLVERAKNGDLVAEEAEDWVNTMIIASNEWSATPERIAREKEDMVTVGRDTYGDYSDKQLEGVILEHMEKLKNLFRRNVNDVLRLREKIVADGGENAAADLEKLNSIERSMLRNEKDGGEWSDSLRAMLREKIK